MSILKRSGAILVALVMLAAAICAIPAFAEGEDGAASAAENVAESANYTAGGSYDLGALTDGDVTSHVEFSVDRLKITSDKAVAGVYLKFYLKPSAWEIAVGEKTVECGQSGFLHEYVDLGEAATELTLTFPRGADVSEIELYTDGALPASVQRWEQPLDGGADLVMFSSHADDEQLFFAGVLPDAVAKGARCEVVYFCDHSTEPRRVHEQLNGLWTLGVKYYPVFGIFPDLYSESYEQGKSVFAAQGYDDDDFLDWQVENIRRFRPQVLVIHDDAGEYGHGTHIINSKTAREAVDKAADSAEFPMSVASYGVWETPKVYMHLYPENAITLDFDVPLDYFGGKTAYEMSCLGFAEHKSQHWTWFYKWMYGIEQVQAANGDDAGKFTSAKQIESYSPTKWGLWRTTVGPDTKADLFDNIVFYTRPGDEPRGSGRAETDALTTAPAETAPVTTAAAEESEEGNPQRDRLMKIVGIAAAVVVVGMIIALVVAGTRSRGEAKRQRRRAEEQRQARSAENARRVREARSERARRDEAENAAEVRRIITSRNGVPQKRDPSGKGAEREAAIRAARAARDNGAASPHDKPSDKRY